MLQLVKYIITQVPAKLYQYSFSEINSSREPVWKSAR